VPAAGSYFAGIGAILTEPSQDVITAGVVLRKPELVGEFDL
jgi:hypothetical protein